MIRIPDKCKFIFEKLTQSGFDVYAVGGCVRDSLMGVEPHDWDFTTNALPEDICRIFCTHKLIDIGKRYGTVGIVDGSDTYEITTFRNDDCYSDNRHPDSVFFSDSVYDDLSRRDFTVNSIAYSPVTGFIDTFNGIRDIKERVIRCVGVPKARFDEDALRILRALRFSATLDFDIHIDTALAISECRDNLKSVHPFRMSREISGILTGKRSVTILQDYADILAVIIPELVPMFGCVQNNPHHKYNVWEHTLKALECSPADEVVRLAIFFHDIGKPFLKTTDNFGVDHFKKHQLKSVDILNNVLRRFGYSSSVISDVSKLVLHHDERFRKIKKDIKLTLNKLGEDLFNKLLIISNCDISAQSEYKKAEKLNHLNNVKKEADRIIKSGECYSLKQLALKGDDVVSFGYKGKAVGEILNSILLLVIKDIIKNDREELLTILRNGTLFKNHD